MRRVRAARRGARRWPRLRDERYRGLYGHRRGGGRGRRGRGRGEGRGGDGGPITHPGRGIAGDPAGLLQRHRAAGPRRDDRQRVQLDLPRPARAARVPVRALRVQRLRERPRSGDGRLRRLAGSLRSLHRDRRGLRGRQREPALERTPADRGLSLGERVDGHHDVDGDRVRRPARARRAASRRPRSPSRAMRGWPAASRRTEASP